MKFNKLLVFFQLLELTWRAIRPIGFKVSNLFVLDYANILEVRIAKIFVFLFFKS
jgi:hypothetical protein